MIEVRKNPDGKYITSCEDFIEYSDIAGKLSSLKYKVEGWIEDYGQDAILSIYYSEDTYEYEGITIKYWRPSKKSEINRHEKIQKNLKLIDMKKFKKVEGR